MILTKWNKVNKWIGAMLLLMMSAAGVFAADDEGSSDAFSFLSSLEGVYQSQLELQADGSLLLVWVQKGQSGLDLFVARQNAEGTFSSPLQINQRAVGSYTGDGARPGIAVAAGGAVAVVWAAKGGDIMLASGSGFGQAFEEPVKLNQDEGSAYRAMPTTALAPDGSTHVVWLDSRGIPEGMEEPANLYHATVADGKVIETNLTEHQSSTVCGCCRPFISISDAGEIDIAFRNENDDGYRDIWRIEGTVGSSGLMSSADSTDSLATAASLSKPVPASPPIWKLNACPMAGPIVIDNGTLWKDASTGAWRTLWATDAGKDPEVLFADQGLEFTYPPRTISGRPDWVLIGAKPASLIATHVDGEWRIVMDDLPDWVTSAVAIDGQLILMGNKKGRMLIETRSL